MAINVKPSHEARSLANANEAISAIENSYVAQGQREKLSYRKGFEMGFGLAVEYWQKGVSLETAVGNSSKIIDVLVKKE
tara:strand:- start:185 stop:421 length:237 start_codon:yes stop_codon:yes gene_type:complete